MQTIIGIVICLIVGIYFLIGFMNTHEGLQDNSNPIATTAKPVPITVPLTSALANSTNAVATMKTIVPAVNNSENKRLYTQHIDNLMDYCDLSILNIINNAVPTAEGVYNVHQIYDIVKFSDIKEALVGAQGFIDL